VRGHALSMPASPGGTATHHHIAAPKLAVLLRGGLRPPAYAFPAARRATRDLLRGRLPRLRQRAAWCAHVHQTTRQSNRPERGTTRPYTATRQGVAARFADPAVPQRLAVDRELSDPDDQRLTDLEPASVTPTNQPDARPATGCVPCLASARA
jgi:hypothetical protein